MSPHPAAPKGARSEAEGEGTPVSTPHDTAPTPGARAGGHRAWLLAGTAAAAVAGAAVLAVPALREAAAQAPAAPSASPPGSARVASAATPAGPKGDDALFAAFTGDLQAGQRVAMGASGAGAQGNCFQCHGLHGEGDGAGVFPWLAGQPAWYLYKQLGDYTNGTRANTIMTPIALRLSPQERRDVAAYYAAARAAPERGARGAPQGGADAELLQQGGALAAIGSQQQGVQNCVGCHGPGGTGMPPDTPYLAGLSPRYLELQLQLWADGRRSNDVLGVMADVARRLSPEDRRAVARYFGSLPPPAARPPATMAAPLPTAPTPP